MYSGMLVMELAVPNAMIDRLDSMDHYFTIAF
jgi:hypothetical protein